MGECKLLGLWTIASQSNTRLIFILRLFTVLYYGYDCMVDGLTSTISIYGAHRKGFHLFDSVAHMSKELFYFRDEGLASAVASCKVKWLPYKKEKVKRGWTFETN